MAKIEMKEVEVTLEDGDWDCLLTTAFYDGIWYWAIDADKLENESVRIYWDEGEGNESSKVINKKDVETAWAKIINKEIALGFPREYLLSGDMGDVDAIAADCLIQAALFGEIIYG